MTYLNSQRSLSLGLSNQKLMNEVKFRILDKIVDYNIISCVSDENRNEEGIDFGAYGLSKKEILKDVDIFYGIWYSLAIDNLTKDSYLLRKTDDFGQEVYLLSKDGIEYYMNEEKLKKRYKMKDGKRSSNMNLFWLNLAIWGSVLGFILTLLSFVLRKHQ